MKRNSLQVEALEGREMPAVVLFTAYDPDHGTELWKTDGTAKGTKLVKDIMKYCSSTPLDITQISSNLWYFTADDGKNGRELWMSNGGKKGTKMIADCYKGFPDHGAPGSGFSENFRPNITKVGDKIFFTANGGPVEGGNGAGIELWYTTGKKGGARMVEDIILGPEGSVPSKFVDMNGTLFFEADDGEHQRELWRSDGTEAGTYMVKDIQPGNISSYVQDAVAFNGKLIFAADTLTHGDELWISDGTEIGTFMLKDIDDTFVSNAYRGVPRHMTVFNNSVFFSAQDGLNNVELWVTDGTTGGTREFMNIAPNEEVSPETWVIGASWPNNFTVIGNEMYFSTNINTHDGMGLKGTSLWKTDGTVANTTQLKRFQNSYDFGLEPAEFTNVNGELYFRAGLKRDLVTGILEQTELYKSNGTPEGTFQVKDINPGKAPSTPTKMQAVNGKAIFFAENGPVGQGREPWVSDGTEGGTVLLKDIYTGISGSEMNDKAWGV